VIERQTITGQSGGGNLDLHMLLGGMGNDVATLGNRQFLKR
jgi:hypothetical protein